MEGRNWNYLHYINVGRMFQKGWNSNKCVWDGERNGGKAQVLDICICIAAFVLALEMFGTQHGHSTAWPSSGKSEGLRK